MQKHAALFGGLIISALGLMKDDERLFLPGLMEGLSVGDEFMFESELFIINRAEETFASFLGYHRRFIVLKINKFVLRSYENKYFIRFKFYCS